MDNRREETTYVTAEEMSQVVANTLQDYTDDGMVWDQEK